MPDLLVSYDKEAKGIPIGRAPEVNLRNNHTQYIFTWLVARRLLSMLLLTPNQVFSVVIHGDHDVDGAPEKTNKHHTPDSTQQRHSVIRRQPSSNTPRGRSIYQRYDEFTTVVDDSRPMDRGRSIFTAGRAGHCVSWASKTDC